MSESGLKKIGVIGIGTMGNGIAQVAAQSGFDVVVMDVDSSVLDRGLDDMLRFFHQSGKEHHEIAQGLAMLVERRSALAQRFCGQERRCDHQFRHGITPGLQTYRVQAYPIIKKKPESGGLPESRQTSPS